MASEPDSALASLLEVTGVAVTVTPKPAAKPWR